MLPRQLASFNFISVKECFFMVLVLGNYSPDIEK